MVIKLWKCSEIYCFKTIFLLNLHTLFEISRSYDKIIEILEREEVSL